MQAYTSALSGKQYLKIGKFSIRRGRLNWKLFCFCWNDHGYVQIGNRMVILDFGKRDFLAGIKGENPPLLLVRFNKHAKSWFLGRRV